MTKSTESSQYLYSEEFYKMIEGYSRNAADAILPLLLDLFPNPSVVDIGCGNGTWLKGFQDRGVTDFLGVDGSYVDAKILKIPTTNFQSADLSQPLSIDRKFDISMTLEVGEHIPTESSDAFVDTLTSLAPVVMFSAAIPHQGGDNHINEQWQDFWAAKFRARGYIAIDYIRPQVWGNENVAHWYSQNVVLYIHQDYWNAHPELQEKLEAYRVDDLVKLRVVHPTMYLIQMNYLHSFLNRKPEDISLKEVLNLLPQVTRATLSRKLGLIAEKSGTELGDLSHAGVNFKLSC
jgi:SAM-dependent methyltransferase